MLHKEIFTEEQINLLRFVKGFRRSFFLVGGTAIALHLGHRRSIDFDLFSKKPLNLKDISKKIRSKRFSTNIAIVKKSHEFTLILNNVKFTFYHYTFPVEPTKSLDGIIRLPSLLQLAAMKVHALQGRAKWKDYVDLFFILRDHYTLQQISDEAERLFQGEFNLRLLRQQLCLFGDVSYAEEVEYMGTPISEETIKKFLRNVGTSR